MDMQLLGLRQYTFPLEVGIMAADWLSAKEAGKVIKDARERSGLTQEQVAERVQVDKSYISKLEGGAHHAGRSKYLPALAWSVGLTDDELVSLNPVAVFRSELTAGRPVIYLPHLEEDPPEAGGDLKPAAARTDITLRITGLVAANPSADVAHDRETGRVSVSADKFKPNTVAYQVAGDCMDDGSPAAICDGDVVLCDTSDLDLKDGKLYVVQLHGNGTMLKRVRVYEDGTVHLLADSDRYRPLMPSEGRVIGRVYLHKPAERSL